MMANEVGRAHARIFPTCKSNILAIFCILSFSFLWIFDAFIFVLATSTSREKFFESKIKDEDENVPIPMTSDH